MVVVRQERTAWTRFKQGDAFHRFLDFVSTRSPVFKERPLPKSKKEAIDLMVKQPNLIKRPILVRGSKVTFGFNKDAYDQLS